MCCIYAIRNKINNKMYIGSTKNFKWRVYKHRSDLNCNRHKSKELQNNFNIQGIEDFEFIILEEFNEVKPFKELIHFEDKYIKQFNSIKNGYNIELNTTKPKKIKEPKLKKPKEPKPRKPKKPMTEEHRRNIAKGTKKAMQNSEVRKKISDAGKGRTPWNKGIKFS